MSFSVAIDYLKIWKEPLKLGIIFLEEAVVQSLYHYVCLNNNLAVFICLFAVSVKCRRHLR